MSKKMLIDASHPEETRVVIVNGSRIEELDFESSNKRQLRGNVYLARVTRVEPSLQAAFVEYGGNRHGFLAFSEIHPDYYQIPYEDRMALIEAEEAENLAEDQDDDEDEAAAEVRCGQRIGPIRVEMVMMQPVRHIIRPGEIIDQQTGLLVPSSDPESLRRALDFYIDNPLKQELFGNALRQHIDNNFSKKAVISTIKGIYSNFVPH